MESKPMIVREVDRITLVDSTMDAVEHQVDIKRILHPSALTDRDRTILNLRFGLYDCNDHSCQEIGRELKLSGERIRVLVNKSLWKLERLGLLQAPAGSGTRRARRLSLDTNTRGVLRSLLMSA